MKDGLSESEAKGYEDGLAGRIRQRSEDPNENRWCWYYEPDDEQWNAYQYGQGKGNQARLSEENDREHTRLIKDAIGKACINATGGQMLGYTKPPVRHPENY